MPQKCEDVRIFFGRHKGKRLGDLLDEDAGYLDWLQMCDVVNDNPTGLFAQAVAEINLKYQGQIEQAVEFRRSDR